MNKIKETLNILLIIVLYALYPIISFIEFYYRRNWKFIFYAIMSIPFYIIVIIIMRDTESSTPHYILKFLSGFLYITAGLLQSKLMSKYYNDDQKIHHLLHLT